MASLREKMLEEEHQLAKAKGVKMSVLKDWVTGLGLRHQGVLLTAVRGCDTAPKDDPSKMLCRCLRNTFLNCHNGDPTKAVSFIEAVPLDILKIRMDNFRKNLDHYPHHYVMHLIHAVEIVGYKIPAVSTNEMAEKLAWLTLYFQLCRGLHMPEESERAMDARLNADEETFGVLQKNA